MIPSPIDKLGKMYDLKSTEGKEPDKAVRLFLRMKGDQLQMGSDTSIGWGRIGRLVHKILGWSYDYYTNVAKLKEHIEKALSYVVQGGTTKEQQQLILKRINQYEAFLERYEKNSKVRADFSIWKSVIELLKGKEVPVDILLFNNLFKVVPDPKTGTFTKAAPLILEVLASREGDTGSLRASAKTLIEVREAVKKLQVPEELELARQELLRRLEELRLPGPDADCTASNFRGDFERRAEEASQAVLAFGKLIHDEIEKRVAGLMKRIDAISDAGIKQQFLSRLQELQRPHVAEQLRFWGELEADVAKRVKEQEVLLTATRASIQELSESLIQGAKSVAANDLVQQIQGIVTAAASESDPSKLQKKLVTLEGLNPSVLKAEEEHFQNRVATAKKTLDFCLSDDVGKYVVVDSALQPEHKDLSRNAGWERLTSFWERLTSFEKRVADEYSKVQAGLSRKRDELRQQGTALIAKLNDMKAAGDEIPHSFEKLSLPEGAELNLDGVRALSVYEGEISRIQAVIDSKWAVVEKEGKAVIQGLEAFKRHCEEFQKIGSIGREVKVLYGEQIQNIEALTESLQKGISDRSMVPSKLQEQVREARELTRESRRKVLMSEVGYLRIGNMIPKVRKDFLSKMNGEERAAYFAHVEDVIRMVDKYGEKLPEIQEMIQKAFLSPIKTKSGKQASHLDLNVAQYYFSCRALALLEKDKTTAIKDFGQVLLKEEVGGIVDQAIAIREQSVRLQDRKIRLVQKALQGLSEETAAPLREELQSINERTRLGTEFGSMGYFPAYILDFNEVFTRFDRVLEAGGKRVAEIEEKALAIKANIVDEVGKARNACTIAQQSINNPWVRDRLKTYTDPLDKILAQQAAGKKLSNFTDEKKARLILGLHAVIEMAQKLRNVSAARSAVRKELPDFQWPTKPSFE